MMKGLTKRISLLICVMIIITGFICIFQGITEAKPILKEDIGFHVQSKTDYQYKTHIITQQEVDKWKSQANQYKTNDYHSSISGHGTGLAPPADVDWNALVGQTYYDGASTPPIISTQDLSKDPRFPTVGNQGSQNSCVCWASTYYSTGYNVAKVNNWTDASTGNVQHLLSPAWSYNKIDRGLGLWSWFTDAYHLSTSVGTATLNTMPYNQSDSTSWGSEAAWREAPLYRGGNYDVCSITDTSTIKSWVDEGYSVNFAMYASGAEFDPTLAAPYIVSTSNYQTNIPDHGQTIIGYNDSITMGSDTGAYRVINSWGTGWGDSGYYWMTYAAMGMIPSPVNLGFRYHELTPKYQPKLVAIWLLDSSTSSSRQSNVTLGIGTPPNGLATRSPVWLGGLTSFPTFMALDITDFYPIFQSGTSEFFLSLGSSGGKVTSFQIELYLNKYTPGLYSAISPVSPDCPKDCSSGGTLTVNFPVSFAVSITSPNGGESWAGLSLHNINWNAVGGNGTVLVNLEYSTTGNSGTWIPIAINLANNGSYIWTVPNLVSSNCYIKITATDSSIPLNTATNISAGPFSIIILPVPEFHINIIIPVILIGIIFIIKSKKE